MAGQRKCYEEAEASLRKGDLASAIKKFEQGFSEEGDLRCLRRLGKLCEDGAPGTDPADAVTWYEKGAEEGDRDCALRAGILFAEGRHTACDYDKAFRFLQGCEKYGDREALNHLGLMYMQGLGTEKDGQKAVRCFRRAVDLGDPGSLYLLGACYEAGIGVETDIKRAIGYFERGAAKNDARAVCELGAIYIDGRFGVEADPEKGAALLKKATAADYPEAWYNYACALAEGKGVEKNENEAFSLNLKAARAGYPLAMYQAGEDYSEGTGTEKDIGKALVWFEKAAGLGQPDAMFSLGGMYDDGDEVPRDLSKAFDWYVKAAKAGNLDAMYSLGLMYHDGDGVEKDRDKAIRCFKAAADGGYDAAMYELGCVYMREASCEDGVGKATKYWEDAAMAGNADAMYSLALCALGGDYVQKDTENALDFLNGAAERGDGMAAWLLGSGYIAGDFVERNTSRGIAWLEKATNMKNLRAFVDIGRTLDFGDAGLIDRETARKLYDEIVRAYPGDVPEYLRFGVAEAYYLLAGATEASEDNLLGVLELKKRYYDKAEKLGYDCRGKTEAVSRLMKIHEDGGKSDGDPVCARATGLKNSSLSLASVREGAEKILRERFDSGWELMDASARESLVSGLCLHAFVLSYEAAGIDSSSVALHATKALEICLSFVFSERYVSYLKSHGVSPDEFVQSDDPKAPQTNPFLVCTNEGKWEFREGDFFRLGNLPFIAGLVMRPYNAWLRSYDTVKDVPVSLRSDRKINAHMLDYLDEEVFLWDAFPGEDRRERITDYVYFLADFCSDLSQEFKNPGDAMGMTLCRAEITESVIVMQEDAVLPKFVSLIKPGCLKREDKENVGKE